MKTSKAEAQWNGSIKEGKGKMKLEGGAFEGPYSFGTRFESEPGTTPEELLGAALAGCYSMAMSLILDEEGLKPTSIKTKAEVDFGMVDDHPTISGIRLYTKASIPGIDNEKFQEVAAATKNGCPVSRALKGVEITLEKAELV